MAVKFEELGTEKGYSFNLVDLGVGTEMKSMEQKLIAQLQTTGQKIQASFGRKIAKIYIGKTYVLIKKKTTGEKIPFKYLEPDTWKMKGIGSRWDDHKSKGRDGLVVLAAITSETVPVRLEKSHEQFALLMEQKLTHLSCSDPRIENDTFTTGRLSSKDRQAKVASCVYMAFTYATEQEETLPADTEQVQNCPLPDQSSPSFYPTDIALPSCPGCQKLEAQFEKLFSIVAGLQDEVSLLKERLPVDVKVEHPAEEHTPPASLSASKSTSTNSSVPNQKSQPTVTVKKEKSAKGRGRK